MIFDFLLMINTDILFQEEVREVDSRLQRQGDTCRKERTCDFQRGQVGALGGQAKIIDCLNDKLTCLRIPVRLQSISYWRQRRQNVSDSIDSL